MLATEPSVMDKAFKTNAQDLMNGSDVKGVLCTDERGQPLFHDGTLTENSAGVISQLAQIGAQIDPLLPAPIITLISAESRVVLARSNQIIVAVHRDFPSTPQPEPSADCDTSTTED